jgi:four helix bundle protein
LPAKKKIRTYKDLVVWQRAIELAAVCWQIVDRAPRRATAGIASQLTRAAESVSALIAEGHGRPTRPDYAHYVGQALGSVREVESHLHTLERVRGVRGRRVNLALSLNDECARMLAVLHRRLRET